MAGSIVVECRKALVALLGQRPNLEGVQIEYGYPGDDVVETEAIYTGMSTAEHSDASMKAGRRFRRESAQFDVLIQIQPNGTTIEECEERALELGLEVEECVADEKYLGGVDGLIFAGISGWRLNTGLTDIGQLTHLIYTIRYQARLT